MLNNRIQNLDTKKRDLDTKKERQAASIPEKRHLDTKKKAHPIFTRLEKGVFGQKNPHLRCVPLQKKRSFLTENSLFQAEGT